MKKNEIMKIIKDGGATLNKDGVGVSYSDGFQCSKKDLFTLDAENVETICEKINNTLAIIANDEFLGLWIDGGKIYIDLSIRIEDRQEAIETGKKYNQIALWDWNKKESLYLATV